MTEYKTITDLTDIQAGDHVTITHGPDGRRATTSGTAHRDEFGVLRVGTVGLSWGDVEVASISRPVGKVYWPSTPGLYTVASRDEELHLYRLFRLGSDGEWAEVTRDADYIFPNWKDYVNSGLWTLRRLRIAG